MPGMPEDWEWDQQIQTKSPSDSEAGSVSITQNQATTVLLVSGTQNLYTTNTASMPLKYYTFSGNIWNEVKRAEPTVPEPTHNEWGEISP